MLTFRYRKFRGGLIHLTKNKNTLKRLIFGLVILSVIIYITGCDLFSSDDLNIIQNNEYDPGSSLYIGTNPLTPSKSLSEGKPIFTWSSSPLANPVYHLQVSENADCSVPIINEAGLTVMSYEVPEYLPNNTTLYWRVSVTDGNGDEIWSPVQVLAVKFIVPVKFISNGKFHTAAIKDDNSLWMAGDNFYGYLGIGNTDNYDYPVKVMDDVRFVQVTSHPSAEERDTQVYVITTSNTLYAWGKNSEGQLGDNTTDDKILPTLIMENIIKVAGSGVHTIAIDTDGKAWAWGRNYDGQLGDGSQLGKISPVAVSLASNVKDITLEDRASIAVLNDGSVYSWGAGWWASTITPQVKTVSVSVNNIYSCSSNTYLLDINNDLWAVGENGNGTIGDGTTIGRNDPVKVLSDVSYVNGEHSHVLALKNDETLWKWGNSIVSPAEFMADVLNVSAGVTFDFAVKSDNSVWVWGYEPSYGATGDPNIQAQSSPQEVVW